MQPHRILIVTGVSGGGKSTANKALEDAGWFCIDNLPIVLLPKLLELAGRGAASDEVERLALVVDAREGRFLEGVPAAVAEARAQGHQVDVLFLDCADEALLRRYSETRRRHPLSVESTVQEGIAREREALRPLREIADEVIDSTRLSVHELRDQITARFGHGGEQALAVTLLSFGFRHGLPASSDLVFDVRFLPNPYFVEGLKAWPGSDPRVSAWVLEKPGAQELLGHLERLLGFLLPQYRAEGKSYLTVAVGCTGGRHRSVAIAEELGRRLGSQPGARVRVIHRDVGKV